MCFCNQQCTNHQKSMAISNPISIRRWDGDVGDMLIGTLRDGDVPLKNMPGETYEVLLA